jgi:hypothetical protein
VLIGLPVALKLCPIVANRYLVALKGQLVQYGVGVFDLANLISRQIQKVA